MGNCANKPLTTEGEAPMVTEEKPTTTTTEVENRDIVLDQNKVILVADDDADNHDHDHDHNHVHDDHGTTKIKSLAQMFEDDGKKPEAEGTAKPAEEKPTEPVKIEEVTKTVAVEAKKEEAPKPAAAEPPKPETSEPKKEEVKPTTTTPATVVDDKKPTVAK